MASAPSVIDRGLLALRRARASTVARAFVAGGLVGWVVLFAYYLEEVEGVRTLRPALGVLLALAFWGRAFLLAGVARSLVVPLLPRGAMLPPMRFADVARTASVVAVGLFFWLWLPILGSYVGVATSVLLLAPLCLRGAVAPTWIARAGAEPEGGLEAFLRAFGDLGSDRAKGVFVELLLLLGGLSIFANLVAATTLVSLLGRSFLGLDVADLETFFSTKNSFVLLALAVVAAVALEPIRAAISAVLYVEARARREGFDLEAAVKRLARSSTPATALSLALAIGLAGTSLVRAEPPSPSAEAVVIDDAAGLTDRDWAVQERVDETLARSEFLEHEGVRRGRTLRELVDRFVEWLTRDRDVDVDPSAPKLAMPPGWVFGVFLAVVAAAIAFVALRSRLAAARDRSDAPSPSVAAEPDPRDRPPEAHLDEAARLAACGAHREAFRALYLATLVALDRRGAIAFDRTRTNWHYLRSMSAGATREDFHRFTALFDRKWYGDEATSEAEYRSGRELASRICAGPLEPEASAAR